MQRRDPGHPDVDSSPKSKKIVPVENYAFNDFILTEINRLAAILGRLTPVEKSLLWGMWRK